MNSVGTMWTWISFSKEHCWEQCMMCGGVCVYEEGGWFEDTLFVVQVDVCECMLFVVEDGE